MTAGRQALPRDRQCHGPRLYAWAAAHAREQLRGRPGIRRQPVLHLHRLNCRAALLAQHDVGKVDGVLGQQSRTAVKAMQVKYGLPADSWPTTELLARMRGGPRAQAEPLPAAR